jgi:capsular exopolysaccharide synthesis family protein
VSRINEALQRAAGRTGASAHGRAQADSFVSAWDTTPTDGDPGAGRPPEPQVDAMLTRADGPVRSTISTRWNERMASSRNCDPALLEQFRRLAGTLHNAQVASGIRTVMVTSTNPSEGKTLTALNLAVVLSESYGRRVLLIDADLRRPSISEVVDVTGSVGLSAALKAKEDQKLAVVPLSPTLTILPAGPPDPDPLRGLTSARMKRILDEAAARFDWVILDGPPTGPLADSGQLSQMVEGTLFVIRACRTPHASVQKAIAAIGRERVLGVVLNGTNAASDDDYLPYYGTARDSGQVG